MSFTYIIRSDNILSGTANDGILKLTGLPYDITQFDVEVLGVFSNLTGYFEIRSSDFPIINGVDTKNNSLRVIANSICNYGRGMFYRIENFNSKHMSFTVVDSNDTKVSGLTDWIVMLKLTPIKTN